MFSGNPLLTLGWLPDKDSNLNKDSQNLLCYHYTIGQTGKSLIVRSVRWSRRWESNPQPPVYKTGALPLSYAGKNVKDAGAGWLGISHLTAGKVLKEPGSPVARGRNLVAPRGLEPRTN